ncbi:MAG: MoaD/ThiS family protein [Anaerolineae bacterium]|nr:MoaD/ThiS family protein [Anaerolineae bacterium]
MITVQARLFATLRRRYPHLGLGEALSVALPEGSTVGHLIRQLDLPEDEIKIVFVNGLVRTAGDPLADGDQIGIFPPVGGGV